MLTNNIFIKKIKYFILMIAMCVAIKTNVVYGGFNGAAGSIGGASPCANGIYCWTRAYTGGDYFIGLRVSVINSSGTLLSIRNYALSKNSWQQANDNAWAINTMAKERGYSLYYGTGNVLGNAYMVNSKIGGDLFHSSILFGDVPGSDNFFGGGGDTFINWLKDGTYAGGGGLTNLQKMIEGTGYPCLTNPEADPGLCGDMSNHYVLVEPMALFVINNNFWLFTAYEAAKYLYVDSSGVGGGTYFKKLFNLFHLQSNLGGLIRGEGGSGVNCGSWTQCRDTIAQGTSPRRGFGVVAYNVSTIKTTYTCEQVLGIIDAEDYSNWYDYRDATNRLYNAIRYRSQFTYNGVNYGVVTSSCPGGDCDGLIVEPDNWTTSCTKKPTITIHNDSVLSCDDDDHYILNNVNYPPIAVGSIGYNCSETLKSKIKGNSVTTVPGHVLPLYLNNNGLFAHSEATVNCKYSAKVKIGTRAEARLYQKLSNSISYLYRSSTKSSLINNVFNNNKLRADVDGYLIELTEYSGEVPNSDIYGPSYTNCVTTETLFSSVTYCDLIAGFTIKDSIDLKYNNKWSFENGVYGNAVTTVGSLTKESIYGIPIDLKTKTGRHNLSYKVYLGNIYNNNFSGDHEQFSCSYVVEDYTCRKDALGGCISDNIEETNAKGKTNYDYEGMKLAFRIIDTSNPFVAINGSVRNTGANWCFGRSYSKETGLLERDGDCTGNNNTVINNIIDRSNSYSGGEPLYTITLRASDIEAIRGYNDTNSYSNYDMRCDSNSERCLSNFISNLNNITGNTTLTGRCGRRRLPGVWSEAMFNCV